MTLPLKIKYPYRWVDPSSEYPENRDIFLVIHVRSPEHWTKILSAGLEGAYLLYPDDHHDVSVPLMEFDMGCTSIADCLLENIDFLNAVLEFAKNDASFMRSLNQAIVNDVLIDGNSQISDNQLVSGLKSETTSLDVVWGGCREVTEYMLDVLKTICFFLRAFGDIQDLVQQLYSKDKNKRYQFEAQDALGNPISFNDDGEIANSAGEWQFVPNLLGQLVYGIAESTMLAFLTELAGLGADLILADINDTREESISCAMFNVITCFGSQQKPPPYTFDNQVFYDTGQAMLLDVNVGLAGNALALMMVVTGLANSFVSVFPLDEVHRNFRIGMKNPSSEWTEICDTCSSPVNWSYTFDFTLGAYSQWWEGVPVELTNWVNHEITSWEIGKGYGLGRVKSSLGNQSDICRIRLRADTETFTSISVNMFFVTGQNGGFANQLVLATTPTNSIYIKTLANTSGNKVETRALSNIQTDELYVQVRGYTRTGDNDPMGETWVRSITITGTGFNPFV